MSRSREDDQKALEALLASYQGVWVWIELSDGKITEPSLEILGAGRKVADLQKEDLVAVLLGHKLNCVEELVHTGADRIIFVDHPLLEHYTTDAYTKILSNLVFERKPSVVFYAATPTGRDLASRVAGRTRAGLAADCVALEVNEKKQLAQIRPDFGGKSLSAILAPRTRPQMTTIRPGVMKPTSDPNKKAVIERVKVDLKPEDIRVRIIEVVKQEDRSRRFLEQAEIVVSVGAGIKTPENIKIVKELAGELGAALGASRAVCERGWLPYAHQVGQSGKTVSPELYIAVGISGAIQHIVGMDQSKYIIAIDANPEAPMLKMATYGVVGDLFEIVPIMIDEIRQAKQMISETATATA